MKDLTNSKEFIGRHIGPSDEHIKTMLSYLNVKSLDELIQKIVPDKILEKDELKLDDAISEDKALKLLKQISQKNKIYKILQINTLNIQIKTIIPTKSFLILVMVK